MLDCTESMRPGAPRIGQIGENFALPRTVPLPAALAGTAGGLAGLLAGVLLGSRFIDTPTAVIGMTFIGIVVSVWLVQWRSGGEHAGRVLLVRFTAYRGTVRTVCSGSARLPVADPGSGHFLCPRCGLAVTPDDGLTPSHEWKGRLYDGVVPVAAPLTGPIHYFPGSLPAPPLHRLSDTRPRRRRK